MTESTASTADDKAASRAEDAAPAPEATAAASNAAATEPPPRPVDPPAAEADRAALADAKKDAEEFKDKLLRTLAEMENLRRRTEREVGDARLYGIASFARDILGVAD